ncbi:hypothetical protein K439DRAFT_1619053 [Ramaria rubella]|nr:hypothetical protein K439DRAFT_1619053 [Ramaria rubella]
MSLVYIQDHDSYIQDHGSSYIKQWESNPAMQLSSSEECGWEDEDGGDDSNVVDADALTQHAQVVQEDEMFLREEDAGADEVFYEIHACGGGRLFYVGCKCCTHCTHVVELREGFPLNMYAYTAHMNGTSCKRAVKKQAINKKAKTAERTQPTLEIFLVRLRFQGALEGAP